MLRGLGAGALATGASGVLAACTAGSQATRASATSTITLGYISPFTGSLAGFAHQGWKPKLATVAKVLLFPEDTAALGPLVSNVATDSWWGPYMPNRSSLDPTLTAAQLANAFQARQIPLRDESRR